MLNLLVILALVFGSLFLLIKVLEGRAQPLSGEQQARLSRWIMVAVFISIVLALVRTML
jgi:hypothetical protein